MANPKVKFKRSSVQGKSPTAGDLPLGEIAINTYDGIVYTSKSTDGGLTTSIVNVSGVQLRDEDSSVGYANTINFTGTGVVASVQNGVGIVTIGSAESYWSSTSAGIHTLSNVGVGTTNPTSALTVSGNGYFTGVVTATSFDGNATTATTATTATNVTVTTSATSSAFKVPFANTTANTTGNYALLQDSGTTFTYNPSTNTLVAGTFSGSGASLTSLNASNISSGTLAIARGGTNTSATPTNGGVSYGTGSAYAFTAAGTSGQVLTSNGSAAPVWSSNINVTGIVTAKDFNSTSDINLKTNIQKIDNPLEKIVEINGVTFNWKDGNNPSVGVIAQEVENVLPQLVSSGDIKTVNYNGLIGLLIESVKEQQQQINQLKTEIEILKNN